MSTSAPDNQLFLPSPHVAGRIRPAELSADADADAGTGASGLLTTGSRRGGADGGHPVRHKPRPPKLYRIGEVVDYSGMSRQTIHNYTTMGLLRETRWTDGGHRLFDESVFERLDQIAELKAQNKSLQHIRRLFARLDGDAGQRGQRL